MSSHTKQMTAHDAEDEESGEHSSIAGGVKMCTVTMEIRVVVQEAGSKYTSGSNYTTLGCRPKEGFIFSQRHLLTHVDCCCIHKSQKLETS